jgi:hypothetical protein
MDEPGEDHLFTMPTDAQAALARWLNAEQTSTKMSQVMRKVMITAQTEIADCADVAILILNPRLTVGTRSYLPLFGGPDSDAGISTFRFRIGPEDEEIGRGELYLRRLPTEPAVLSAFAAWASLSISEVRPRTQVEHLRSALAHSRDIGAAIGVLMARYGLSEDDAFGRLRAASQQQQRKVREIAAEVTFTGSDPLELGHPTTERPANAGRDIRAKLG